MCWMHVSFTCVHICFLDGTFVQFKTFQKRGSSLVTASVYLCLKDWSVASSHHCFHSVTALSMPLKGVGGWFCFLLFGPKFASALEVQQMLPGSLSQQ